MPMSKYNKQFGGKPGSAAKAKQAMVQEYGAKKGKQVFYATKNKRKAARSPKAPASRTGGMRVGLKNGS